jgi:hypothetical protein
MLEQIIKNEDIGYLRLLVDIISSESKEEKKIIIHNAIKN